MRGSGGGQGPFRRRLGLMEDQGSFRQRLGLTEAGNFSGGASG